MGLPGFVLVFGVMMFGVMGEGALTVEGRGIEPACEEERGNYSLCFLF